MHGSHRTRLGVWIAPGILGLALLPVSAWGDDNGFFGRLFRLGGNNQSGSSANPGQPKSPRSSPAPQPGTYESAFGDTGSGGAFIPPANRSPRLPNPTPAVGPISSEGPSTPDAGGGDSQPRLSPRARVAPAVTSADPLLTRMALGKSNDGMQFGMFLQIFADGTVIDSEGVHRLSPSDIRPIAEAIQSGEIARLRGHCGTPSQDFIEYVHLVVYERRMGRLQAFSFSYGGNPQGCEAGIRHLHAVLESVQAKISRPPSAITTAPAGGGAGSTAVNAAASLPAIPPSEPAGDVIPLTPVEPH